MTPAGPLSADELQPTTETDQLAGCTYVLSEAGFDEPQLVTYNATKAAIANMTRCMAMDLAGDNIRVNAAGPSAVSTQIVQRITSDAGMDRKALDADLEWGGAHPLKRIAEPHEIAFPILILAADESSFVTDSLLMADGGYTAH